MSTYINYLKQHKNYDGRRMTTRGDFTMKDDRMYMCINKMKLSGTQYKVMDYIIRHTHGDCNMKRKDNLLAHEFTQRKCADELCITKYQVNQALPALEEKNIITILHSDPIGTKVQLNAALDTWHSSAVQEYIADWIATDTENRLTKASKSTKAARAASTASPETSVPEVLVAAVTQADITESKSAEAQAREDDALLAELEGM
jgi:hypothetical protein